MQDTLKQVGVQDTGKFRNTKDEFYTKEIVAKQCIEKIRERISEPNDYLWIEPSAGDGVFLNNITFPKIGIDTNPKSPNIQKEDYHLWSHPKTDKDIIVFGNPPFGRQSSLAKSFISKSCKFAKLIAFILPRSFTKPSMYNSFDLSFHLLHSVELEKESFLLNNKSYHVPCIFQIWEKRDTPRKAYEKIKENGFKYVKDKYDIALRRVGGNAGKCYKFGGEFSIQSHYFIKFDKSEHLNDIIKKINSHVFPSNTVGPRSLSKCEINNVLNDIILKHSNHPS
jgi:hypothetical protein